ncbi:septum formation initiator family protein [Thermoanaerobacter kivui]|nr:septum formation initiator family protein [Thermoanaerobacter kivui]
MKKRKIKLKPILLIVFIIYVVFTFFEQQIALDKLNNRYQDLKNRETAAIKENNYLNELLRYTQTESFIENEARQKLGLVKKGEIIYIDISKTKATEQKK